MQDAKRALSDGPTEHMIRVGWEESGMWPIDVEVPLKSKMVVREHTSLPEQRKRKRGPAFGSDGVLYNGSAMIHLQSNQT
jgi:hypothetical protein